MGQRLIITEQEKKTILSLYEQTDDQYKKENDFLQRYVGKTFNTYVDPEFREFTGYLNKIRTIKYDGDAIEIYYSHPSYYDKTKFMDREKPIFIFCIYNPSKFSYKLRWSVSEVSNKPYYNKTLVDDITNKGIAAGIQWCKRPNADFGMKQSDSETDKMV